MIKSFEEACELLKLDTTLPDYSFLPAEEKKAFEAHYKLIIIVKALNRKAKPDLLSDKWDVWTPYFLFGNQMVGDNFSFAFSSNKSNGNILSSRLCFVSKKLSDYAGKQFEDIYRDYYVNKI